MNIILIHHIVETLINVLSIAFNCLLLYLIKNHSAFGTPVYQVMLAVDASLDLMLSFFGLLSQPLCVTGAGYKVFFSDGFFAGWSYALDELLLMIWMTVIHFNVMWISIQFVYRYILLCMRDKPYAARRVTYAVMGICLVWGTVGVYMCYLMTHAGAGGTSQEQGLRAFELNGFDMSHKPVVVGSHINHWVLKCWIAMWNVSCLTGIFVVAVLEIKIKRHFENMGGVTHQTTRKMHRDFHRALLAMAICPLVTSALPILFYMFAAFMELSPGPNQVFLSMAVTSITLFNPLTTIFFMRNYRRVVLKPFLKKEVSKIETRATGLSLATSSASVAPSC